jgi:hypothetical protein
MKITVVDGIRYSCPTYLVRVKEGWQIRMPGEPTKFFGDGPFWGVRESYLAAMRERAKRGPVTGQVYPLAECERKSKKRPTGTPGICLCEKHPKGKSIIEYQL